MWEMKHHKGHDTENVPAPGSKDVTLCSASHALTLRMTTRDDVVSHVSFALTFYSPKSYCVDSLILAA